MVVERIYKGGDPHLEKVLKTKPGDTHYFIEGPPERGPFLKRSQAEEMERLLTAFYKPPSHTGPQGDKDA